MNHIKQVLTIFVLLFTTAANAGWVDKQGDKVPDSDHMKSAGSFIAQLVITDNETLLLKNWRTPSESVYLPTK